MIEIQVPKDITTYKTKIIGSMTIRQLVILIAVIGIDTFLYTVFFMDKDLSMEVLMYGATFIDLPLLLFMFEVQGLPMEKFLVQVFVCNILAPTKRRYKCNQIEVHKNQMKKNDKKRKKINRTSLKNKKITAYQ